MKLAVVFVALCTLQSAWALQRCHLELMCFGVTSVDAGSKVEVDSSTSDKIGAQKEVALSLGTGDYWVTQDVVSLFHNTDYEFSGSVQSSITVTWSTTMETKIRSLATEDTSTCAFSEVFNGGTSNTISAPATFSDPSTGPAEYCVVVNQRSTSATD